MNTKMVMIFMLLLLIGTALGFRSSFSSVRKFSNIHMAVSEITSGNSYFYFF